MFTGIVQAIGRISAVEPRSEGVQVAVDAGAFAEKDIAVGDSIALNGCCLTVVAIGAGTMRFDVSSETLSCTTGLDGYSRGSQAIGAAGRFWVRIVHCRHHALDSGREQRAAARGRPSLMIARLQRDVRRCSPYIVAMRTRVVQRTNLGVRAAGALVPALAQHHAVACDHAADARIGRGREQAAFREHERARHHVAIRRGAHSRSDAGSIFAAANLARLPP